MIQKKLSLRRYFKEEVSLLNKIKSGSQNSLPNSSKLIGLHAEIFPPSGIHIGRLW